MTDEPGTTFVFFPTRDAFLFGFVFGLMLVSFMIRYYSAKRPTVVYEPVYAPVLSGPEPEPVEKVPAPKKRRSNGKRGK